MQDRHSFIGFNHVPAIITDPGETDKSKYKDIEAKVTFSVDAEEVKLMVIIETPDRVNSAFITADQFRQLSDYILQTLVSKFIPEDRTKIN